MRERKGSSIWGFVVGGAVAAAIVVAAVMWLRADPTGRAGHGLGREYVYDLRELRKVDPKLILFEQARQIRTQLQQARGLAVGTDGRIYLVGDQAIRVLPPAAAEKDPDPARIRTIRTAGRGRCLAVAEDGTMYVGAGDHVEVYDDAGKLKASWPSPGDKALLTSVALSDEDVFVADAAGRAVLRYDKTGKLLARIGDKDADRNIPGFIVPSPYFDLALAPDGLLRVVNPGRLRVEAYTRDGDLEFWWGKAGPNISDFTGCCNPVNFAIMPDGSFVTCEKGIRRVKLYDAEGKFVGVVAGPDSFPAAGAARKAAGELDVAADAKGRVFVLDPHAGDVKIFVRKAKAK